MAKLSYRMLQIGGAPAGLLGLDEVFADLFAEGCDPELAETQERLLKAVRQHNFIAKPAREEYKSVLSREYQRYYEQRTQGHDVKPKSYGSWQGIPREQIPWFPTVSAALCNGCGKCIEVCPKDVFVMTDEHVVEVVEPFACIVSCCFCKSACDPQAILMPEKSMLDHYRHGQRHVT
ncbi:MAG: 4Fe-4S binding protein [Anaerolineaceae bacterium]|nr:4Fe-4S binding protein [Anaerolineaceae bacterium]